MLSPFYQRNVKVYTHLMKCKKTKKRALTSYTELGEQKKKKKKKSYSLGEAAVALTAGALMTSIT